MKILTTKEYDQFKKVPGNRDIDINHVNYLTELNSKENLLMQFPSVVTKDDYLWDGQHRREVCRNNNWDFPYTKSEKTLAELGDDIVAITNIAQKGWRLNNFITFFAAHEKEQYLFLQEMMREYKLSHQIILQLIIGKTGSKEIKLGKLQLYTNQDEKQVILDILTKYVKLKGTISSLVLNDSRFAAAMRTIFRDFSSEDIIVQLGKTPIKITSQRGVKDYLRVMEDVLNYRKHERNYIRFF